MSCLFERERHTHTHVLAHTHKEREREREDTEYGMWEGERESLEVGGGKKHD